MGTPTLGSEYLSFSPFRFSATQTAPGLSFAQDTFNFRLNLAPGWQLNGITYNTSGDYLLMGSGPSVNASGNLQVFDINNALTNQAQATLSRPANLSSRDTPTAVDWASNAFVDLRSAQWKNVSSLSITVDSLLFGQVGANGMLAFVQQKFGGLDFDIVKATTPPVGPVPPPAPVPEASEWFMLLAGLAVITYFARSKVA
jgi:hypothetical protein